MRRVARGADDGYQSPLVIGLKSSEDAGRLAEELAFAAHRLHRLEDDPPGLYREVADAGADIEERSWLAFLIAYLCPLGVAGTDEGAGGEVEGGGEDPFAEIERVRTSWASGEMPALDGVRFGPRSAHDRARGTKTLEAYRTWAARAGSQAVAYTGDAAWAPERRFARAFERLALPGLHRDARFDLLVTLGRLGVYDMRAGSLAFGGANDVTVGPSARSGSATRCCWSAGRPTWRARASSRSRRSMSACTTGSAGSGRRSASAPMPSLTRRRWRQFAGH